MTYVILKYFSSTINCPVKPTMLMPCEVAVKSVVPAIRCAIAKQLIQTYDLKQKDVASLLGITQTAVSKYIRHVRGRVVKIENVKEVQPLIIEIAASLANGTISRFELVKKVCVVCTIIRQNGLMCELCKRSDPSLDIQHCKFCSSGFLFFENTKV